MKPFIAQYFRSWRIFLGLATAYILACLVIGIAGLQDHLGKADVALVLGAKVTPTGKPSLSLKARLDRTVGLYRDGWFPRIMVSGGLGKEGFDEAVVMQDYLLSQRIPAANIILDSQGWTTQASAQNIASTLTARGWNSVLVVTQYFHVPRSRLALKQAGITSIYSAPAHYFNYRDLYSLPREVIGYISYWLLN